jgi:hypothetical protein
MRNRIFGAIGLVWGGAILVRTYFAGDPRVLVHIGKGKWSASPLAPYSLLSAHIIFLRAMVANAPSSVGPTSLVPTFILKRVPATPRR